MLDANICSQNEILENDRWFIWWNSEGELDMNILNPNYDMRGNALSCTKEGPLPVVRIVPGKLALVGNILETRPIGKEQCQVCG